MSRPEPERPWTHAVLWSEHGARVPTRPRPALTRSGIADHHRSDRHRVDDDDLQSYTVPASVMVLTVSTVVHRAVVSCTRPHAVMRAMAIREQIGCRIHRCRIADRQQLADQVLTLVDRRIGAGIWCSLRAMGEVLEIDWQLVRRILLESAPHLFTTGRIFP